MEMSRPPKKGGAVPYKAIFGVDIPSYLALR